MSSPRQSWPVSGSTLDFLLGAWEADRVLTDFRSGQAGTFRGVAVFAGLADDGRGAVAYQEQGELRFGRHCGPAGRSLQYLPLPGGATAVLFSDGRPFYRLDLRSGYWQAEHPCGCDHYEVSVRVLGQDSVTERWQARGPGQDYEMVTRLTRIAAA